MEKDDYLRIDEKSNIIDSLGKAAVFLESAKTDPFALKWFTIAIHHSAHCLMLFALRNTDDSGIWQKEFRRTDGLIDILDPRMRLIDFMTAFLWIQDPSRMGGYVNSKPFAALPYHSDSMEHLNLRLRNSLIHYKPLTWSISKQYFIDIVKPVLEMMEFLCFKSGRCPFDEADLKATAEIFKKIKELLTI